MICRIRTTNPVTYPRPNQQFFWLSIYFLVQTRDEIRVTVIVRCHGQEVGLDRRLLRRYQEASPITVFEAGSLGQGSIPRPD